MERSWAVVMLLLFALPTQAAVQMYYLHNDHLGTPRVVTNQAHQVVWKGQLKPFGETKVDVEAINNHRRFPGQRFDIESRLYYNYFRDYDPTTGRYIQSDPIGLGGGMNTYAYVGNNPLMYSDPYGLAWFRPEGHEYKAGRRDTIVPEGPQGRGRFIDDYVPAGHTFASMHDKFVGEATAIGFPDWLVNWPFFGPFYVRAVQHEILNSLFSISGSDVYAHKSEDDCG